jgi:hypothetical protein
MPMAAEAEAKFGSPYFFLHRADLYGAIASALPQGMVQLKRRLAGVE